MSFLVTVWCWFSPTCFFLFLFYPFLFSLHYIFPPNFQLIQIKFCFITYYLSAILLFVHITDSGCKINYFLLPFKVHNSRPFFFFLLDKSLYAFVLISPQLPWILCYQLHLDFYIFMPFLMVLPNRILFSFCHPALRIEIMSSSFCIHQSVLNWVLVLCLYCSENLGCKDIVPVFACVECTLFHPSSLPLSSVPNLTLCNKERITELNSHQLFK